MHIVVVDKQSLIFEGIRHMVLKMQQHSVEHTNTFPTPTQALKNLSTICVIIDPENCNDFDIEQIRNVTQLNPKAKTLVFTDNLNEQFIMQCLEANVDGYLQKTCTQEEFLEAFHALEHNKKSYCQPVLTFLCNQYTGNFKPKKNEPEAPPLTHQEIKITELTAWGLTAKEIGDKLNISIHTVNTHRKNIFKKIGVKNASELVMYAIKNGIIDSTEYFI